MPASSNYVISKGREAGEALTKKTFVKMDSSNPTEVVGCDAGDAAYGVVLFSVSSDEIDQGKLASVQVEGRAIVTAGSALDVGMLVTSDADGKAVEATTGDFVNGAVDEPAGAEDDECSVLLVGVPYALQA